MRPLAFILTLLLTLPALAADAWDPSKTWIVMAGVLEWQDKSLSPFPKKDRQDRVLEQKFKDAGVPASQIVFLEDKAATQKAIQQALRETADKAGEGSTLIFYYAGHGMQDDGTDMYIANYDADCGKMKASCVALSDVSRILTKNFKGSRLLVFADCCYSGAFAKVVTEASPAAACLTSATASNVSTAEWTFTAALVSIFDGDGIVDANGDGTITLREADAYVADEMRFKEGQLTRAARNGKFELDFTLGATDPALKPKELPGAWKLRQYCEVEWKNTWYRAQVLDGKEGECRVHYLGWGAEDDEWVAHKRIRKPQGLSVAGGDAIEVEWKKKWYAAKVMKVEGDFAFIHYDGFGNEWDEWVTAKRLRKQGK